jgi:hypothetical protein
MAEIFNRYVFGVAGVTVHHGIPMAPKLRKSLLTLEAVAIMRVATRVSGCKLYELYKLER